MKILNKIIVSGTLIALATLCACSKPEVKDSAEVRDGSSDQISVEKTEAAAAPVETQTVSGPKKHFLWKVSDDNSYVWLLGSIHVADSSFYPLDSVIENAFESSKELGVEINAMDSAITSEVVHRIMVEGQNTDGASLKQLASPEMWHYLDSLGKAWQFPVETMNLFRPWFTEAMLGTVAMVNKGLNPNLGIDIYFSGKAKEKGMPIVSLEGIDAQMDALPGYGLPNEISYIFLKHSINGVPKADSLTGLIVTAWKNGDEKILESLLKDNDVEKDVFIEKCKTKEECDKERALIEESNVKAIDQRNVGMAEKVEGFLKEDRNIFVVVGSAHLVGRTKNIITLLEKKGYKIERF